MFTAENDRRYVAEYQNNYIKVDDQSRASENEQNTRQISGVT